ncbi:restriction endonuclease subunit S, partial [bacterium]|nr:restriction endonuclease subunit S [bacterium]
MTSSLKTYTSYQDSGIDWLGKVPANWQVLATARITDLTTGCRDTQDAKDDGQYPFFVRSPIVENSDTYSFEGEGVLTSGDGAGVGKIFHHYLGKMEIHQRVYLFHNFKRVIGR